MQASTPHSSEQNPQPRVLVVDDDPQIRQLLSVLLRKAGIDTETAADGEEALSKIKQGPYQLVLLDLMMPRVDGLAVIDSLSRMEGTVPPVVVISAAPSAALCTHKAPVLEVLHKPFEISSLLETVRRFLPVSLLA